MVAENVDFNSHLNRSHREQELIERKPCAEANQPNLPLQLLLKPIIVDIDQLFPAFEQIPHRLVKTRVIVSSLRVTIRLRK